MRRGLVVCALAAVAASARAAPAAAQNPVLAPGAPVDGPSAGIGALGGLSVDRDGSAGLVYLKSGHVFASRLAGEAFGAPEQLDPGLSGPSSQPVIAVGDGGLVLAAFVNGGTLYVVSRPSSGSRYTAPIAIAAGAGNPSLEVSIHGKGYLAFTAAGDGGQDVRAAYYELGRWALAPAPLNVTPGDDAGTGAGRPRVAACGDGVGIVAWGEGGHIFTRRVWATQASVVAEQADVPSLSGALEVSADEPAIGREDNSTYASVAWHEVLSTQAGQQSRVLQRRLHGSQFDGVTSPDGLTTPGVDGADQPGVVESNYASGMITSSRVASHQVFATVLRSGGAIAQLRVDSLPNATLPFPVAAMDGLDSSIVAWQRDPGLLSFPEIRLRQWNNGGFGPEQVASVAAFGPTEAASGLAAGGDLHGDAAVAWVQGTGDATRIVVAQLLPPPGGPKPKRRPLYVRTATPRVSWTRANMRWGAYSIVLDGRPVAETADTSVRLPRLLDGPHHWQVSALNRAGTARAGAVRIFVDTVRPSVTVRVSGTLRSGAVLGLAIRAVDRPPRGLPRRDASGVRSVTVNWGDGTRCKCRQHAYGRPGTYRLTVTATDRAGNARKVVRRLTIG